MRNYKTLNIEIETYRKVKQLADKEGLHIKDFVEKLVDVYKKNHKLLATDTDNKVNNFAEKLLSVMEKNQDRITTREANRVIGFIRTNDKFIRALNSDFHYCYGLKGGFLSENPLVRNYKSVNNFLKSSIKTSLGSRAEKQFRDFLKQNLTKEDMLFYDFNMEQIGNIEGKEW